MKTQVEKLASEYATEPNYGIIIEKRDDFKAGATAMIEHCEPIVKELKQTEKG